MWLCFYHKSSMGPQLTEERDFDFFIRDCGLIDPCVLNVGFTCLIFSRGWSVVCWIVSCFQ